MTTEARGEHSLAVPDYMSSPNAVLKDVDADWRYGQPPDYSKTRKYFAETKSRTHAPGSVEQLVENLVKNWEIEASFKTKLSDWRTVDFTQYSFAVNGAEPSSAEHMLRVGTYSAILVESAGKEKKDREGNSMLGKYYDAEKMDFASSHKTFKRAISTFAWEVLEVYTEAPVVAFKWRHWGVFAGDYSGMNRAGEHVKIKAHGRNVNITGVTVAYLSDSMQVTKLKTWFDPEELVRQMDPDNKAVMTSLPDCPVTGLGSGDPSDVEG
ncbi:hypothetical protein F5Y16DRAFT_424502 [Xylariaceae sp. FL0255]|nr:hypothetical protein F5Y16DRAFT_424502 [Xylariaceae sp. FL0255]